MGPRGGTTPASPLRSRCWSPIPLSPPLRSSHGAASTAGGGCSSPGRAPSRTVGGGDGAPQALPAAGPAASGAGLAVLLRACLLSSYSHRSYSRISDLVRAQRVPGSSSSRATPVSCQGVLLRPRLARRCAGCGTGGAGTWSSSSPTCPACGTGTAALGRGPPALPAGVSPHPSHVQVHWSRTSPCAVLTWQLLQRKRSYLTAKP